MKKCRKCPLQERESVRFIRFLSKSIGEEKDVIKVIGLDEVYECRWDCPTVPG